MSDVWGAMLGGAAGMFYGNNRIKPGSQSSIDTGRLDDPGFKHYHKNLYRFFHDADADVVYWEWNAFKKVAVGATAYTLSCKQNDSCVLNFLETNDQDIDMSAKGPDDPAFAFGSTVRLRWYDVRGDAGKTPGRPPLSRDRPTVSRARATPPVEASAGLP